MAADVGRGLGLCYRRAAFGGAEIHDIAPWKRGGLPVWPCAVILVNEEFNRTSKPEKKHEPTIPA